MATIIKYAALAIIAFPMLAVAAPTKFDLQCTGTVKDQVSGTSRAWSDSLKIDLDSMRYCSGAGCSGNPARVKPIQQVTADQIILVDTDQQTKSLGHLVDRFIISRSDNSVASQTTMEVAKLSSSAQGACFVGKFTGF